MQGISETGTAMSAREALRTMDGELAMTNVIIQSTIRNEAEVQAMRAQATGVGQQLDVTA